MAGDGEFEAYAAAHWPRLVRAAVLLGADTHEAQDVAQAALVRCLQHWGRVSGADDRDAYVHRVLVTTFLSARRRRWTGERPTERLPDRAAPSEHDPEERRSLLAALAELPDAQRAVVVLRFYADLSERQTAEALGVRPGTVKSRLSRAVRTLADHPTLSDLRGVR